VCVRVLVCELFGAFPVVCVLCVCVCELWCVEVVSFVISVWRVSRSVVVLGLWLSSWYSSR
jgi:hypothetical protein